MGQFKPMVKMMTTEPSVELKLAKGGAVKMKKGGSTTKAKKMAMGGGAMDMMSGTPALVGRPAVNAPVRSPMKPSMASRRKAMMAKKPMPAVTPSGPSMAMPPMKKGGKAEGGESKKTHKAEMSKMKGLEKELKSHASKPASKGHKGLKTGGVTDGQGGYKTGGVVLGNGGGYKTGGVALGNGGGYKMGGKTSKKAYATGGTVNTGKPVAMPQGAKKPSSPVSINELSGTFKKGGKVTPAEGNLMKAFGRENASAMKSAKAQSNEVYSKYGNMKMKGGGATSDKEMDMSKGAYDAHYANEKAENEAMRNMVLGVPKKLMEGVKGMFSPKAPQGQGAVTKTEKSITVSPAGKRRGGRAC